jgi:hypothetical protein
MSLAEEKQQLETLLRQVKSIQSLSAILPPYAQGIDIYTACVSALQAVLANLLKYHVVSGTVVSCCWYTLLILSLKHQLSEILPR